ncbi:MAG: hypothetical protein Q9197_002584 [Variospora fuerteventurae]
MAGAPSPKVYIPLSILVIAFLLAHLVPDSQFTAITVKFKGSSLFTLAAALAIPSWAYGAATNLRGPPHRVLTSSGLLEGHRAPNTPSVSEFLGIPFAQPPVGGLRFAAPQPYRGRDLFRASTFSLAVRVTNVAQSSVADSNANIVGPAAAKLVDATQLFGKTVGEDCLKLNVWTKPTQGEKKKAVLFWLYGGGFTKGTTNTFLYDGEFLADTQDVIVVSANYRVSLFGFPGLPGLDQNVGLLDQRLAVEWVRDNIAAFGGDPNRITLFGQSAGGSSIDYYSYTWLDDPIVHGFITESGVVNSFFIPVAPNNTAAWYGISQKLGCGDSSAGIANTVACMRQKPMADILGATATAPPFGPTADGKTVLADYTVAGSQGRFIKKPMLLGNTDYEAGMMKVLFGSRDRTLTLDQWAIVNLQYFTCPVASAGQWRAQNNVPVWRYRYYGEFPNLRLTIDPSSGAWHGSEIATVFGTAPLAGLPNTAAQESITQYIMSAWAAFAKNPSSALSSAPFQWPLYDPDGATLIRLAHNNSTQPSFIDPITYDYACPLILRPGGPDKPGLANIKNLTQLGGGSEMGY